MKKALLDKKVGYQYDIEKKGGMGMPFRDLPGVTLCRFKRGDYLIRAGEQVEYVYYLLKGTVYRESVTDAGRERILSSKASGDIVQSLVGILILYRRPDTGVSSNDFIAHTNCACYRIPKDVCMEYLRRRPALLEDVVRTAMDEYMRLMALFQVKEEGHVAGQLCNLLLERGRETEQGVLVSKKFTNVEMAKFLSVHKVTVARILRVLKEEGSVARTTEGLLLKNPEKLQQYAENKLELKYK